MADPRLLAGTASVTIDGVSFSITGEGVYRVSGAARETLEGQDGPHGYSEKVRAGKIAWKGRDSSAVLIAALNAATNVTVVLSLANGKTIIGRNMWRVGDPIEVNTEDASFSVEFDGTDVVEA